MTPPATTTSEAAPPLLRLHMLMSDRDTARLAADRLGEPGDLETGALATSWLEEPTAGGWLVEAYYAEPPDPADLIARIGELIPAGSAPVIEPVPDVNWVALSQASLPPVAAGRFVIHGSHDRARVAWSRNAIEIDAGEAFGTAHHATTHGCLGAIDKLSRRRRFRRVLDLGCGSGVLAIAASRAWPDARVTATDIDRTAVEVATVNVRLNRAAGRIRVSASPPVAHLGLGDWPWGRYDLVVANILAGPLIALAPRLTRAVAPGGTLVLSGILGEQAREVIGSYVMAGMRLVERHLDHNWATLTFRRPPSRRGT